MAISREDIDNIAHAVAELVTGKAQRCRCGVAAWETNGRLADLFDVINDQNPNLLDPLPKLIDNSIADIEVDCGVDMSKAKELNRRVENTIQREDWKEAKVEHALLLGSIAGPLYEGSIEEET